MGLNLLCILTLTIVLFFFLISFPFFFFCILVEASSKCFDAMIQRVFVISYPKMLCFRSYLQSSKRTVFCSYLLYCKMYIMLCSKAFETPNSPEF
jgi:hypothetical protein